MSNQGSINEAIAESIRRKNQVVKLKKENADLLKQVETLKAEKTSLEADVVTFSEAFESLDPDALDADMDELAQLREFREQVGNDPQYTRLSEEIESLKGKIRDSSHRTAFDTKAKELGFNPDALADVWEMSGYKAASDDVDEAAIETALSDLKARKSWLLKPAGDATATPAETSTGGKSTTAQGTGSATAAEVAPVGAKPFAIPATQPGAGSGRGTPETPGKPLVTVADMINAQWAKSGRSDATTL